MAYPIPPWIPDSAQQAGPLYAQGLQVGAGLAEANARLQQQAALATMEAAAKQEQSQREMEMEKQRMEISRQYQQIESGLKQRELDQQQQQISLKVNEAARQFAAQQRYQQLIDSGSDPAKALLEVGPDLGISMTGAAQLYKETMPQPNMPPTVENYGGHEFLKVPEPYGRFQYHPLNKAADPEARNIRMAQLHEMERMRDKLESGLQNDPGASFAAQPENEVTQPFAKLARKAYLDKQKKIEQLDAQIQAMYDRAATGETSTATATAPTTSEPKTKRFRFDPSSGQIVPATDSTQ